METAASAPAQSSADAAAPAAASHSIEERAVPAYFLTLETKLEDPYPLYFIDGVDDLPYVELQEWAEILGLLNTEFMEDEDYELSWEGDDTLFTYTRDNGYSMQFDFSKDRIRFDDYNAFLHESAETTVVDLLSQKGSNKSDKPLLFQHDMKASFDRYGDEKVINLANYGIHLINDGDRYLVPMQTVNDLMLSGFLYNGEALFFATDENLYDYRTGSWTSLAEEYYSAPAGALSEALAAYSYGELCMILDNLYGLKGPHDIDSFAQTFWEIGFDEALSGTDAVEADDALHQFINYYLDDQHSVMNEYSYLTGERMGKVDPGMSSKRLDAHSETMLAARKKAYPDGMPGYEEVGNTAYISFDNFTSSYGNDEYFASKEANDYPEDTIGLIIYAHGQITRAGSPIKNVVLDLSNNTGGAADAAVFVISWFLGDATFSVKDMSTGAMSSAVYRADVNLDGVFDENDTVADKNLYCLISPVSFSCGNLVPAALKASQKVSLLGKTSGGGSCVVQPLSTAYGSVFQISGARRMSFLKNGSFYDIDQGVDPDYPIDKIENYYNRKLLTNYIGSLF